MKYFQSFLPKYQPVLITWLLGSFLSVWPSLITAHSFAFLGSICFVHNSSEPRYIGVTFSNLENIHLIYSWVPAKGTNFWSESRIFKNLDTDFHKDVNQILPSGQKWVPFAKIRRYAEKTYFCEFFLNSIDSLHMARSFFHCPLLSFSASGCMIQLFISIGSGWLPTLAQVKCPHWAAEPDSSNWPYNVRLRLRGPLLVGN